jgi:integrase
MEAARDNRYGARDAALIFTMYRHGLRVSEVCALDWSAIDCLFFRIKPLPSGGKRL